MDLAQLPNQTQSLLALADQINAAAQAVAARLQAATQAEVDLDAHAAAVEQVTAAMAAFHAAVTPPA